MALTIDNILKKYEHRQEKLRNLGREERDSADTARNREEYSNIKSGLSTPEFSSTMERREKIKSGDLRESLIERTQKKQEYNSFNPHEVVAASSSFPQQRSEMDSLLLKLDQTQEKLVRAQRNYADIWRKYEKLLNDSQITAKKEVEIEQKLRKCQAGDLQTKIQVLDREANNLKDCIASKDATITVLRQKLSEKNQRAVDSQRILAEAKSQNAVLKAREDRLKQGQEQKQNQKDLIVDKLQQEIVRYEQALQQKDQQKAQLLEQLKSNLLSHRQQLQVVKEGYLRVEEEYKQWIDQNSQQKLQLIDSYEQKLRTAAKNGTQNTLRLLSQEKIEEQLARRDEEIQRLQSINGRQTAEMKKMKAEVEQSERTKAELVLKVSCLENSAIDRTEVHRALETAYSKLVQQYKHEEERGREAKEKYHALNREFLELRNKCQVMFGELEEGKSSRNNEGAELLRVRKELLLAREQLEKQRSHEYALNRQLTEAVQTLKARSSQLEAEKQETTEDLLAERLENARLKEEVRETKEYLKREYELSLQSTRKELEGQIANFQRKESRAAPADPSQEQLYLQFRQLERKYELLASEIVTVDEMMGLAAKVSKRHLPHRK